MAVEGGWNTRLIARCGAAASSIFSLNAVLRGGICLLRLPENMCCSFCSIMIIFMYSSGGTGWKKHICTQNVVADAFLAATQC